MVETLRGFARLPRRWIGRRRKANCMANQILVIGATGGVGRELVARLLERGVRVRAATRHPELARSRPGVDYVEFDFERPATFASALAGAERVFMLARPGDEQADRVAAPLVAAMRETGIEHIVNLTAMGVERLEETALRRIERLLEDSGLSCTHLRPNWFMQIFATPPLHAAILATGMIRVPTAEARISFIDVRDVAEVAREALLDPRHRGRAYTLTGGTSLGHCEVAETIACATNRSIKYVATSEDETRLGLGRAGLAPERVERVLGMYRLVRQGFSAPVSPDVPAILGRPPRTLLEFARDYAAVWRASQ
jgi:uncharacterized protein YbjT (DUF2867 family)